MTYDEILSDKRVLYVLQIKGIRNKSTISGYYTALRLFCMYAKQTPSTLIETAIEERKQGIEPEKMIHFLLIISFRNELATWTCKNGIPYAASTIGKYMSVITTFFNIYHFAAPPKSLEQQRRASSRPANQKIPNKELIRKALKFAGIRDRAIILVAVSSGLSAIDICNLTAKQFYEGYNSKNGIVTLQIARQKTGRVFTTFLSPEASQAVFAYLHTRDKDVNEMINSDLSEYRKIRITPDSPLFIRNKKLGTYIKSGIESDRALTTKNIQEIYTIISEKISAKSNTPGVYNLFRSHNMRKFFASALLNAGCDFNMIEHFMGHQSNDTVAAYFKYQTSHLEETYQKYLSYLLINESDDIENSLVYKTKEHELESVRNLLKEQVNVSKEYHNAFDELQRIRSQQVMMNKEATLQNELLRLTMDCEITKVRFIMLINKANFKN
ncbi:hypothetical protein Mpsy_0166 [Methanolobus psychrophilus R15]|nr:hypothetical protein Mpsy_0166 [Methanolobus psychrophilus R15]